MIPPRLSFAHGMAKLFSSAIPWALGGSKPVPESSTLKWSVVPRFADEFIPAGRKDAKQRVGFSKP